MKLSVVIPTYNEISRLPITLQSIKSYLDSNYSVYEIILSDGGSTDGTDQFIKEQVRQDNRIKGILRKKREGKGAGVKLGMLEAKGDWVLFMDADNSTKIEELKRFWQYTKRYQVVIGSRYAGIKIKVEQNYLRRLVSRAGGAIIRKITGLDIRDTQCGFKLFSQEASRGIFERLQTRGWGFDAEALLLAEKLGYKIKEVPVEWRDSEGSHIRAGQDSLNTLIETIRIKKSINQNGKGK